MSCKYDRVSKQVFPKSGHISEFHAVPFILHNVFLFVPYCYEANNMKPTTHQIKISSVHFNTYCYNLCSLCMLNKLASTSIMLIGLKKHMNKSEWVDVQISALKHQRSFRGASAEASAKIRTVKQLDSSTNRCVRSDALT